MYKINPKKFISIALACILLAFFLLLIGFDRTNNRVFVFAEENIEVIACESEKEEEQKAFIKWIDFNADSGSLKAVLKLCKEYRAKGTELEFSQVLAYLAIKNSNKFSLNSTNTILKKLRTHLDGGGSILDFYADNKYYNYYLESYHAIFDGLVGEFSRCEYHDGEYVISQTEEYGIKGFFPIAADFHFSHYDDFGSSRSYGYKRRHLGHDFMGQIGTPIIAIEGGIITELGWNKYGGWRIGIRSFDQKRYYYYAHLRKDRPFAAGLALGDEVKSGQVIGYLGHTGYSIKENVNLKTGSPHLHLGLQIIFDKSQEKGSGEIWLDLYGISKFLLSERAKAVRDDSTKEWVSQTVKVCSGRVYSQT